MLLLLVAAAFAGIYRVDVLDIGQGDAILIRSPAGKTVLIDAADRGVDVVGQLKREGVSRLDLVVASHPHADHIGSMQTVIEAFTVGTYVDSGLPHTTQTYATLMAAIEAKGVAYRSALVGQSFKLDDGGVLDVLFPAGIPLKDTRSDLNSNSVVLRLSHGEDCFLFMGDAEEPTERALLDAGLDSCDVLKVAHHGSNHSSTPAFLAAVKPRYAAISVGAGNRYNHPGTETLERLTHSGATLFRTDRDGQITFYSDGKDIRVVSAHGQAQAMEPVLTVERVPVLADASPRPSGLPGLPGAGVKPALPPLPFAPPVAAKPAEPAAEPAAACPYVGSQNGAVFHGPDCAVGAKIYEGYRVCYVSRQAATAAGRRPASCCDP